MRGVRRTGRAVADSIAITLGVSPQIVARRHASLCPSTPIVISPVPRQIVGWSIVAIRLIVNSSITEDSHPTKDLFLLAKIIGRKANHTKCVDGISVVSEKVLRPTSRLPTEFESDSVGVDRTRLFPN